MKTDMSQDPSISASPLGKSTTYVDQYDASLLFPIERATQRAELGLHGRDLPFFGADLWTAFELSWLNPKGKPQVAIAHFTVPCESPNIIESKSFKLYLNSFNNSIFGSMEEVAARVRADVSSALWKGSSLNGTVGLRLLPPEAFASQSVQELEGVNLDRLDIECDRATPAVDLLRTDPEQVPLTEVLTSQLLKSNCPVTGQPDWGSVQIAYSGHPIDQAGLLAYIVSYRNHNDFHEHCVERMFLNIWKACRPTKLSVFARYTRRGGLDINPFRASWPQALPPNHRTARQ